MQEITVLIFTSFSFSESATYNQIFEFPKCIQYFKKKLSYAIYAIPCKQNFLCILNSIFKAQLLFFTYQISNTQS